ncbi:hypothetical protein AtNW77_Chr1g0015881 [Arabidopsis thaliana]|uniref:Uncharacterized protein n=2 Tax=Arabidopsis thaliana TaxID=3702 RepID=A0A654E9P0_ARATH|nr:uncharacterized protein AT1G14453 [Arabidopsis thaliana]ANM59967.1 hypothetical protein AT1G14453 [Arabidopsis thaliana]CAA0203484.1 unnamed protein product [Arabidopsis thaliana]VYS46063.1 unnamed protein product [Arabidopsis thaliana]|eukprot:NP_001322283.1 hypothetical protein AT1G14453 [Arabidopsis thaliana]
MLFSETEQSVPGGGEMIWKEPKLCCRSAHRRDKRRRRRRRFQVREERVSFDSKASDASSIHLFAGKIRRLFPKASPFSQLMTLVYGKTT